MTVTVEVRQRGGTWALAGRVECFVEGLPLYLLMELVSDTVDRFWLPGETEGWSGVTPSDFSVN
jgi:hypothetical protein